jgi:hypothetical protein
VQPVEPARSQPFGFGGGGSEEVRADTYSYYRSSRDLESHAVLYFLTYEYSWGQLMGYSYGFFFCSLPEASSLLQLGPVQNLGWGRTD